MPAMRDELSVSGAHTSQSCSSTSALPFVLVFRHCLDTITPSQTRRETDMKGGQTRPGWEIKSWNEQSLTKRASTQSHAEESLFLPAHFLIIWLSAVVQADMISIAQVLPSLPLAFVRECQMFLFVTRLHFDTVTLCFVQPWNLWICFWQ